jgi:DNA-binding NarL/FixJ family response regulator
MNARGDRASILLSQSSVFSCIDIALRSLAKTRPRLDKLLKPSDFCRARTSVTVREWQTLALVAEGKPCAQIAADLHVSYKTIAIRAVS